MNSSKRLATAITDQYPVPCDSAFRYERLRREDTAVSFGGRGACSAQYLHIDKEARDGGFSLHGPDIPELPGGSGNNLGIEIKVKGPGLKEDFEELMERQTGRYLCDLKGVVHGGGRGFLTLEIGRESFDAGLSFRHLASAIRMGLMAEYGPLLESIEISICTEEEHCPDLQGRAEKAYAERDSITSGLTDEGEEIFYSCNMCQCYVPYQLCIISPERDGLCGRFTWRGARLSHMLDRHGPITPVAKGRCIDEERGEWEGVNEAAASLTLQAHTRFSAYSLTEFPEPSCSCAECIAAIVPEADGVMVVNRSYRGATPAGMNFEALMDIVGRGRQVPGFVGISLSHVTSRKFLKHHGGIRRIVWMPSELKQAIRKAFTARCSEEGIPELPDMIGDEFSAPSLEDLLAHLSRTGHPAINGDRLLY